MKVIYVDIHIHTSQNPNNLSSDDNISRLLCNARNFLEYNLVLLSLTNHNTINKSVYLKLINQNISVVLVVEFHIEQYPDAPPYYCHIIFNSEITEEIINSINVKLNELYPKVKMKIHPILR